MMDDFVSESESDYTSYWRDWVSRSSVLSYSFPSQQSHIVLFFWFRCDLPLGWPGRKHRTAIRKSKPPHLTALLSCRCNPSNPSGGLKNLAFDCLHCLASTMTPPKKARTSGLTRFYNNQFISSRGNEYFCEIDEEYLTDRFNLTGLNTEVQYYQYALDLITDVFDLDCDDDMREAIEKSARHLYGLVHARYIVTTRGLAKMVRHFSSYHMALHRTALRCAALRIIASHSTSINHAVPHLSQLTYIAQMC